MRKYKDQEILDGIKNHDHKILNSIYINVLPRIENLITNSGGSRESAMDVFQDAMMAVYRKVENEGLFLNCKFTTYIYAVCRNIWFQELKYGNRANVKTYGNLDEVNEPEEESEYKNEMYEIFDEHIKALSPDCQRILKLHFERSSIEEIMKLLKYKNTHYTIDRKYRCKQSLVKRIINDPRYIEISNGIKNKG